MIGFSLRFVDDLWSNWCYVVLLLMLDDLDVLLLIYWFWRERGVVCFYGFFCVFVSEEKF